MTGKLRTENGGRDMGEEGKAKDGADITLSEDAELFSVPMRRRVQTIFLFLAAVAAGVTVWSFRSGLFWTGMCLLAVAGPMIVLYWFMLVANPSRNRILVDQGMLYMEASPFLKASLPLASAARAFMTDIESEPVFKDMEKKRSMVFFGYRAGQFAAGNGKEVLIVARSSKALCLETGSRYYLLGPSDMDGLSRAVSAVLPVKP